jgi:hypothetical protein
MKPLTTSLEKVRQKPDQERSHHICHNSPPIDIVIHYQPGVGSGVGSLSYGVYTGTTVKDNNPLFNRLKDKAAQLKKSRYEGIRGVIVCDGGSQIFKESGHSSTYSMKEVIREFFRINTSVFFVATIGIKSISRSGADRLILTMIQSSL